MSIRNIYIYVTVRSNGGALRRRKYAEIANDPVVERWLANIRRGNPLTARILLRRFGRMCELLGKAPKEILEEAKENPAKLQDALEDIVSSLEAEGNAPSYITGLLNSVRSLARYHDVILPRKIKISNSKATPTIEDEQVPTQEELARIIRRAKPRARVAISLLALGDLRLETLGNHDGTDGLMLKDLPELKVTGQGIAFEKIPTMVVVRSSLSKARHKYFTFLVQEGCTHLKEYLEERLRKGETLGPGSPVIGQETKRAEKPFMLTTSISDDIRKCMRAAGVRKRPYVLRAYAETQLIIAESRGKISHPYLQFIAGHKGDIEARYSTNKGRLPPDMIEGMREAYKNCESFLGTAAQPLEQTSVVKEAKLEAIKSIAKSLFPDIDHLEVNIEKGKPWRELTPDEKIEFYEKEIRETFKTLMKVPKTYREDDCDGDPRGCESKLIREDELVGYLNDGWDIVRELQSGKIAVRKLA